MCYGFNFGPMDKDVSDMTKWLFVLVVILVVLTYIVSFTL